MNYKAVLPPLLVALFSSVFLWSCGGDHAQSFECVTSEDCASGLICVEHSCVQPEEQSDDQDSDNSTIIVPDEGQDDVQSPDGNDTTDDMVDEQNDTDGRDEFVADADTNDDGSQPDTESIDEIPDEISDDAVDENPDTDSDTTVGDTDSDADAGAVCGNGVVEGAEQCDLGVDKNNGQYDGCNEDCTLAAHCGDGTVNRPDEACDSGEHNGEYGKCNADCSGPSSERCGDGIINGPETCDDGPHNGSYGYCNAFCSGMSPRCGDGVIQAAFGEQCDAGEENGKGVCEYGSTDACTVCSATCKNESGTPIYCGDGTVNGPETCDDGTDNGEYGKCNADCSGPGPHCGDGIVNGTEACDDGNDSETDYCDRSCEVIGECGDGIIQSNEECDEGKFCENDTSKECTDDASVCGGAACITIQKNGCNPHCSTDMDPPTVVSVDPRDGKKDVLDTILVVNFSEPMDFHTAKITLLKEGETVPQEYVPREHKDLSSFSYAVTLDFTDDFQYTAVVVSTATDSGGNALGSSYEWHFTVDKNECLTANGGCEQNCLNNAGGYDCSCNDGYQLAADNLHCDDIDECADGSDNCDQTCVNTEPGFTCSCTSGYRLQGDGHSCVNIDECLEHTDNCDTDHGSCTDQTPGFECSCNANFRGDGVSCTLCDTDSYCGGSCSPCGGSTPRCKTVSSTVTTCVQCLSDSDCPSGSHCDNNVCGDVDECAAGTDNCDEHATCTNQNPGFSCTCNLYYYGDGTSCTFCNTTSHCEAHCIQCPSGQACKDNGDGTTVCVECTVDSECDSGYRCSGNHCVDVNECAEGLDDCTSGYSCQNTAGSFNCVDINECDAHTDDCDTHADCTNTPGSFTCTCKNYYTGDGTSCTFCDSDSQCGASCTSCGGTTPKCKSDGTVSECVQCLDDGDCSSGEVCNPASNTCEASPVCPSGWNDKFGRCFYFSTTTKSYDDAESWCESQGGHLVTIEDSTVDDYVAANTSDRTWIGLDGRTGAYKVTVTGVPGYSNPHETGDYGGRYHGDNTDSTLWRHAEIYKITPGKTGYFDITVEPTDGWDPQIRVFDTPTENALGAAAVGHAWATGAGEAEHLTVQLTGGTTYYVATTHCDGCVAGAYNMFISYSGVEDTNYQKHGWPTGVDYDFENWYGSNPNNDADYCVFMYGGNEWDEFPCTESYHFVCDKPYD